MEINYQEIIEKAPEFIAILDSEGNILYFNKNKIVTDNDYIYTNIFEFLTPENQKITKKYIDLVFKTGDSYNYEIYTNVEGNMIWFEINVNPLKKGEGVELVLYFYRDITERKLAEKELKDSEEKLKNILQNITGMVYKGNPDWSAEFISGSEDICGYTLEELNSQKINWIDIIHRDDKERVIKEAAILDDNPIQITQEYRIVTKQGKIIWVSDHKVSVFNKESFFLGVNGIAYDISNRKESEQEIIKTKEKYQKAYTRAEFYKDLFTHDINNILQSIISTSEYYKLFKDDIDKMKDLGDISQVIISHAKRGSSLVSNVRKLSKLDNMEISFKLIDVSIDLNDAINNVKNGFQERDVEVKINGLLEDFKVLGNDLLKDVFENILHNAVKFALDKEKIIVEIYISRILEEYQSYIKFEFIDNGIGVPDHKKKILFQRQTTKDISERSMGIGLSLVKKIVDRYGGQIWVEDRVKGDYSKGCKFILMLKES